MITIINYGSGNIRAITNIFDQNKVPYIIANSPENVERAEKILLPGVGAFDETISVLNQTGFREVLDRKVLSEGVPVIGVCVGMQILGLSSEEGVLPGLGWINGTIKKFQKENIPGRPKLPHMGWNTIEITNDNGLFKGIPSGSDFYFLHSYYFDTAEENTMAKCNYGDNFACAVNKGKIFGVQFHPEKSHHNGVRLLLNFAEL